MLFDHCLFFCFYLKGGAMRIVYFIFCFSSIFYGAQEEYQKRIHAILASKGSVQTNPLHRAIDINDYQPISIRKVPDCLKEKYGCDGLEHHHKKQSHHRKQVCFKSTIEITTIQEESEEDVEEYQSQSSMNDMPPRYRSLEIETDTIKLIHHKRIQTWVDLGEIVLAMKNDKKLDKEIQKTYS